MKRNVKSLFAGALAFLFVFLTVFGSVQPLTAQAAAPLPTVQYRVHVQSKGWTNYITSGVAGTTGLGKRLEAMQIQVSGVEGLGVRYRSHVQTYGWQDYVADGALSGTTGKAKRMEAVQIELTGVNKDNYDIYYRLHVQSYGWLNWAKNGEVAGTKGYAKRAEAIEIRILPRGSARPQGTGSAFVERKALDMTAHVQSYGWMSAKDSVLGTTGQGKRLEAITITPTGYDLNVEYSVHVQSYGWTAYARNGQQAGTTGQGKRLEAVRIRLTGNDASKYDIYYRTHVQKVGWLDWAKNDEIAGSTGASFRMEAMQVVLVPKGQAAPGATTNVNVITPGIAYSSYVQDNGWQGEVSNQQTSGTTGRGLALQDLRVRTVGNANVGVRYSVYRNGGWSGYVSDGASLGNGNIEAVKVELTGNDAKYFDVYYRVHSQSAGWLGWACNGNPAGVVTLGKCAQAIEIAIRSKAQYAPGVVGNAYRNNLDTEAEGYARARLNEIGWNLQAAFNWSAGMPYFTNSTDVPAGYTNADWYAIYGFRNNKGNCYNMAATFYQMAKLLGYDVHYVQGYLPQANGRRVTHGWCEIVKNGAITVYDPNFTYNTGRQAFGITYGTPGTWRYSDYQRMN